MSSRRYLEEQLGEVRGEQVEMQTRMDGLKRLNAELKDSSETAAAQARAARETQTAASRRLEELQTQLKESQAQLADLKREVARLQRELEEAGTAREEVQTQAQVQAHAQLREEVQAQARAREEAESQAQAQAQARQEAEVRVQELEQALVQAQEQVEALTQAFEEAQAQAQVEKQAQAQALPQAQSEEVDALKERVEHLKAKVSVCFESACASSSLNGYLFSPLRLIELKRRLHLPQAAVNKQAFEKLQVCMGESTSMYVRACRPRPRHTHVPIRTHRCSSLGWRRPWTRP